MGIDVRPDWWKTLFDEVYLMTDARSVCDDKITCREVDLLLSLVPLKPADKILDLCGGQGRHSIELSRRGFKRCTVVDYSRYLIEEGARTAAEEGLEVKFIRSDARHTNLLESGFDRVLILGNSLGYLPDPEDDRKIMGEAWRLLKPGGSVVLDVTDGTAVKDRFNPNAWHEIGEDIVVCRERELDGSRINAREVVICKKEGLIRDQTYSIQVYEPEDLEGMVKDAGFINVETFTDFSFHDKKGDYGFMNHRMILTGKKQ